MVEIPVSAENPSSSQPNRPASVLIATGIMLSRIAGLVRESIFAAFLGLGAAADALAVATRIPNVMQMLLGEGTLSASFIPVYSAELERDEEEAGRIAGAVASLLALTAATIVIIAVVAAEPIAWALAPGFRDDARFDLTVTLMRITFPAAGFLVLSAWCLGILNSHRQFFLSYVAPVLWNVAQITAVAGAVIFFGVGDFDGTASELDDVDTNVRVLGDVAKVAAWGFLAGSFLQFFVQLPNVMKLATGLRFRFDLNRQGVQEVLRRFGGAVLGRGVVQISAMLDTLLASLLVFGAVGALVKAQVLYVLPISLFAISVAASELPELSRLRAHEEIRDRAQAGFRRISFFVSFAAVAYLLLGDKIVATLFERGEFTSDDTLLVWFSLGVYALGLPASGVSRLTQNTLWSQGDTSGPARIAAIRVTVAVVLSASTMWAFDRIGASDVRDVVPTLYDGGELKESLRFGAVGITLGSAVGAWVEALLLWRLAARAVAGVSPLRPLRALGPSIVAAAIVALIFRVITDDMWSPLAAALSIGFAGLAYLGMARATHIDDVDLVLIGPLKALRRSRD